MMSVPELLKTLAAGLPLCEQGAEFLFERLLAGEMDPAQIAAALSLIQVRSPTVDELVGAARVMRRHVTPVPYAGPGTIIDTCGTGGAPKTFNVSTISSLVVAAAGEGAIKVAKHGNRSRSGRGSAEVLGALGVSVDATPQTQARCLEVANVCFCFAIHHHPATRHAAPVRQSLGFPTIFNLLGPMTNPARATRQLLGVYNAGLAIKVANALSRLGTEHAWVVHGEDGSDDITTTAPTRVVDVTPGRVASSVFDAATIGVPRCVRADLEARDLGHAVRIARDVLDGQRGACRDIVVVNAAVALHVAGLTPDVRAGVSLAERAIDGRGAARTLAMLAEVSRGP